MALLLARAAAPYCAVIVGLLILHSAWLALLLYHAQIILLSRRDLPNLTRGWRLREAVAMAIPAAATGPLTYLLLPVMLAVPLSPWLAGVGLSHPAFGVFVFYYGLIHPPLEQAHWSAIRRDGRLGVAAHVAYAGYHAVVLQAFMHPAWAAVSLSVLVSASYAWHRIEERVGGGCAVPAASHLLADFGMVVAVWLRACLC